MGAETNNSNVMASPEMVEKSSKEFHLLFSDMSEKKKTMEEQDQNMYSAWFGPSGDIFKLAAYTIESSLGDLITREENAAVALDQTYSRFSDTDNALYDDIETNTIGG